MIRREDIGDLRLFRGCPLMSGTGGEEVENGHANRNSGGDLIEDQRLGAVRQGVGNVESAQDGAGVHDVCARPGQFHVGRGEAEALYHG